ncbi:hypothetical protein ACE6H2_010038 [Prunus campanulata]
MVLLEMGSWRVIFIVESNGKLWFSLLILVPNRKTGLARADEHGKKADVSCKKENLPEFDRERGTVRGSSSSTDQIEGQVPFDVD